MASPFSWQFPISIDDGNFFVTYFDTSQVGDYTNFVDPTKDAKNLVIHSEFPLMMEKLHSMYIVDGVIESFLSWTENQQTDVDYMMANFSRVPYSAHPDYVTTNIDNLNNVMVWSYDSTKLPNNTWIHRNQQWCPTLPTRLESGRDGTGLVCITLDPTYRWNFTRANLTSGSTIVWNKPEGNTNKFYMMATRNDILANGNVIQKRQLQEIVSNVITFNAANGDCTIGIIERGGLA